MPRPRTPLRLALALAASAALWCASPMLPDASAQATVTVEVRAPGGGPGEARVTLTPAEGGAAHACQTRGGRCELAGVPNGRYVVSASPTGGGQAPIARPVLVGGRATTVRVTLR